MNTRLVLLGVLVTLVATACGDGGAGPLFGTSGSPIGTAPPAASGTLDPSGPGGTGTVPVAGPADWLEWTPAESPDPASEAELVAALEDLDMAMIVPASPPPGEAVVGATFHSMSLGRPTGVTFAGTTRISLNVGRNLAIVSSPASASCPADAGELAVRGDPGACAGVERDRAVVAWREAGHSFSAVFAEGLAIDEALAWLESWRRIP
jgi:hypothetical protein